MTTKKGLYDNCRGCYYVTGKAGSQRPPTLPKFLKDVYLNLFTHCRFLITNQAVFTFATLSLELMPGWSLELDTLS